MSLSPILASLQEQLSDDQIALKGTEPYSKLNKSYLSLLQSDIEPAAIVLPRSTADVVEIIKLLKPHLLRGDVRLAIRGGGQQPVPGCSNIANGITLDLRLLTGIELKDGVVQIGAGERWGAVYEKLSEHGLGVTGSRSALGGIGGLALSGRFTHVSFPIPNTISLTFHVEQEDCHSSTPAKASSATT